MSALTTARQGGGRYPEAGRALALAGALLLAAPVWLAAQEPGATEGAGSAIFSLDLGLVIWTWVLFLLTLGILAWKVFPFIAGGLEERQRKIQDAIDEARAAREEAERLREEQRKELSAARREGQDLVERAREAGQRLKDELLEEGRRDQEAMMERARRDMERERKELVDEVRRGAVEVALAAAERLLKKRLDAEENRRLVQDYVGRLE